eukprot:jgi/Ulvmu1/5188/UM021_0205.1
MRGSKLYTHSRPCLVRASHGHREHGHRAVSLQQLGFAAATAVALALDSAVVPLEAQAVLNSPNAQIARTVDAALRRSTPAFNAHVKEIQDKLENIQFQLRIPQRKPWGGMSRNVRESLDLVSDKPAMMASVPQGQDGEAMSLVWSLQTQLEKLQFAIERKDIDRTSTTVASSLATVAQLEIVQAPALSFQVPQAYRSMPVLQGRATVEVTVEKADKAAAFVDSARGGLLKQGTFEMTLDGFSAPVTAGAFAKLVKDGKYDATELSTGYLTVVGGKGVSPGTTIPLEILQIGEFEPVYRTPLETQQGELAVLPLSIKGACAMASLPEVDGYMSGDEFFIYLFDPQQSGLSGLSFDEGRFGVFGYITKGLDDTVTKLAAGDRIVQAKVTKGLDKLING